MEIKHSTVINKPLDEVIEYFMMEQKWIDWHQNIIDITLSEGIMLTKGAVYTMTYEHTSHTATVIDIQLPQKVTYEFDVGNVKHQLAYTFKEHDDHVHFNVTYTYKFKWYQFLVSLLSKSTLTKYTKSEVEALKEFIESN